MKFKTYFMNFVSTILLGLIFPVTINAADLSKKVETVTKHQETISLPNRHKVSIQLTSINKNPNFPFDLNGFSRIKIKNGNHLLGILNFNTPNVDFKIYNVQGLPNPIIMIAAINSLGVSSAFYSIHPYTIIRDQIEPLKFSEDKLKLDTGSSGFYIGKLPNNEGIGAAIWQFIWSNGESHIASHRYSIRLYRWNGESFVLSKHFITKNKYSEGEAALKEYGLGMKDFSLDFSNLNAVR